MESYMIGLVLMFGAWLANFWFILTLAPLYLRLFPRAGTLEVETGTSLSLPSETERFTLASSIARRDGETVLWLRPRGMDFYKQSGGVAKLSLDGGGRVESASVHVSPGIPLVFVLFFCTAYLMLTESREDGTFPFIVLVVLAALFIANYVFYARKQMIKTLDALVQSAIVELAAKERGRRR